MAADVEIRFDGEDESALSAIAAIDAALESIEKMAASVKLALGDIEIPSGTVGRVAAQAAMINKALRSISDQAMQTRAALALGGGGGVWVPTGSRSVESGFYPVGSAAAQAEAARSSLPWVDRSVGVTAAEAYLASRAGSSGGDGGLGFGALLAAAGMGGGGIGVSRFLNPFGRFGFNIPGARLGSLLGLAGFGAERILGTTLGVGGSMLGGIAGGALYGLGMGGTMAVGMGTDMAGIGQAGGDIRTVTKDLNALDTAIQQYGKNSQQAAQAQAQLNSDLGSFSPVARQAVLNASLASQHFKALFDYFTGPAEKTGAQIIGQGIRTGQAFLPSLGSFASGNMNIIQRGLQPLFSWLQNPSTTGTGGGLGIFNQLEELFQKRLPTAVHAGTQAFELFSHAVLDAAKQTGGFLPKLDEFLTKMNSPQGLARMNDGIVKLIDLFKTWTGLLLSVGKMVYELFAPAVGLGADFARQLTNIVNLFSHWLSLTSTQTTLHNLFAAHRQQLDALFQIMQALLPILEAVISAFAKIETAVTSLTIGPLKLLASLISDITKIPFANTIMGWAGAIYVVYRGSRALLELTFVSKLAAWTGATSALTGAQATLGATASTTAGAMSGLAAAVTRFVGPILIAAAAVYGLDKAIAALTGFDALKRAWGSAGWGADNAAADVHGGKNPYPVGTSLYKEWERGYSGQKAFQGTGTSGPAFKAYHQGQTARGHSHAGGLANPAVGDTFARVDQGVDYTGKSVRAITSGDIVSVTGGMAGGTGTIIKQRFDSPVTVNGRTYYGAYYSEGNPVVQAGDHVNAGDIVMVGSSYEIGFLLGPHLVFPPLHGGLGSGTQPDQSGQDFYALTQSLGGGGGAAAINASVGRWMKGLGTPPGASTVPKGVPSLASFQNAQANSSRQSVLAQGLGALQGITTARGDLGSLPRSWQHRFTPELSNWQQQIEHLDRELRDKSISQKTIDTIRGRIDIITRYIQQATARIQTTVAAFQQLSTGRGLIGNIHLAMTGSLSALGLSSGPLNPMNVDTLGQARATEDPKLKRWEQQLERMDHTLREKTVSQATVNTITQRMQVIQKNVTGALDKIKQAAQTQLQAATSAWSAFTSAFDSTFTNTPGGMSSQQLTAMQNVIGQGQLAVSLDQAQSAILGGQPGSGDQIAQTILNNMTAALGVQTTSTGIPYTQQQLDNWLAIWGNYYASLGYTPKQMFDAFNALLASVGLPPIDNPFSTGNLPLPPGAGPPGSTSPSSSPTGNAGLSGVDTSIVNALHNAALQHASSRGHRRRLLAVHSTSTHAGSTNVTVHTEVKPQVELRFEKGLEWLDGHVKVIVDGEIQKVGQKANARARSGRHTARGRQ